MDTVPVLEDEVVAVAFDAPALGVDAGGVDVDACEAHLEPRAAPGFAQLARTCREKKIESLLIFEPLNSKVQTPLAFQSWSIGKLQS